MTTAAKPPAGDFHWTFIAKPGAVRNAIQRATDCFAPQITADDAGTLELTLAEVLNNVVEHGYCGLTPGPVELLISLVPGALTCRISDQGMPMPGLQPPDGVIQPVADTIDDLAEGGWGWALIREMTLDLAYHRVGSRNHLIFQVPLQSP